MSDIQVFGFEKDDIKGGSWEKYKGKKGVVDRGGIVYTEPTAMFAGVPAHYSEKYFQCKKSFCCEKLGIAKYRIGAVLIKYGTDKNGNIKTPFSYELFPWMFGEGTWGKIKTLNNEFSLTSHDIKIACTNEDYQNLDITPCQESVWQLKEGLKKQILEEAKPIWDYVKKGLASNLSIEEIKELLNASSTTAVDPSSKVDLDSILSNT